MPTEIIPSTSVTCATTRPPPTFSTLPQEPFPSGDHRTLQPALCEDRSKVRYRRADLLAWLERRTRENGATA